jgi:hypothetical protein
MTLLSVNSEYFRLALQDHWVEKKTRTVKLPDVDTQIINIYVNWLYDRKIILGMGPEEHLREEEPFSRVARAYLLGDRLADIDFQDAATDSMLKIHFLEDADGGTYSIDKPVRNRIYQNTKPESKLRQLLVHIASFYGTTEVYGLEDDVQFLIDLANSRKCGVGDSPAVIGARCGFHGHKEGLENCYRTKYRASTMFTTTEKTD